MHRPNPLVYCPHYCPHKALQQGFVTTAEGLRHPLFLPVFHLLGFGLTASLAFTRTFAPLIPLGLLAAEAISSKTRSRKGAKLRLWSLLAKGLFYGLAYFLLGGILALTMGVAFDRAQPSREAVREQDVMWLRPFWGRIFPDLLSFACGAIVLVEVVSCLYRFDRQPDLARQLETFRPLLLPVFASDEDEGQRVVVLPFLLIVKQRLKDLQGVRPKLTYSNLAVIVAFLWFALPSVVLEYFYVRPPLLLFSPAPLLSLSTPALSCIQRVSVLTRMLFWLFALLSSQTNRSPLSSLPSEWPPSAAHSRRSLSLSVSSLGSRATSPRSGRTRKIGGQSWLLEKWRRSKLCWLRKCEDAQPPSQSSHPLSCRYSCR